MSYLNKSNKRNFYRKEKNKVGDYIIGKIIDENYYIKIRKGKNKTTGENVIIKIIDKSYLYEDENNLNNLTSEISILKTLYHKNLIRLYELREMTTNIYIIIEYCENGSLFEYVKNYKLEGSSCIDIDEEKTYYNNISNEINTINKEISKNCDKIKIFQKNNESFNENNYFHNNNSLHVKPNGYLPERVACKLFQDLIGGLEYLHSQSVCIRDINVHNVFIDFKLNLKLANFSFSKNYQNDKLLKTPIGIIQFTSPEVLLGKGYHGLFCDIWSCGVILYFMLTGSLPFYDDNDEEAIINKIIENKIDFPSTIRISEEAKDLIMNILNKDCLERFDLNQIKNHSWFNLIQPKLNKGINVNLISIPIDEKIINKVENVEFDFETIRNKIKDNIHDETTSIYYLFLKKHAREGYKSVSDLESQLFLDYTNNTKNFIKNIELVDREKKIFNKDYKNSFENYSNNDSQTNYLNEENYLNDKIDLKWNKLIEEDNILEEEKIKNLNLSGKNDFINNIEKDEEKNASILNTIENNFISRNNLIKGKKI